jgi:molybdopterin converting factor small subunit
VITLKYYGELREAAGKSKETVEIPTLKDALEYLKLSYGSDAFAKASRSEIFLNGERLKNLKNRTLDPGDELSFISHVAGGNAGAFPRTPDLPRK